MLPALTLLPLLMTACPTTPPARVEQASATLRRSTIAAWLDTGGLPVSEGFSISPGRAAGCAWLARRGQLVAPSHGKVEVAADQVTLTAIAYRNHLRYEVRLIWRGRVKPAVTSGELVSAGQRLASLHAGVELSVMVDGAPLSAEALFAEWAELFDPHREERLVIVDQGSREMWLRIGEEVQRVRIGFGQTPGKKVERGDNKSPRGMYFITNRHRGEFGGPYGAYYGGHWIKVNYPNRFDAQRGLEQGWLNGDQAAAISRAWRKRELTNQKTRLGGGIGFHGWIDSWSDENPWLSWGCLVMHNEDITRLFDQMPHGTMVVLL
jgi:hypothetical protein